MARFGFKTLSDGDGTDEAIAEATIVDAEQAKLEVSFLPEGLRCDSVYQGRLLGLKNRPRIIRRHLWASRIKNIYGDYIATPVWTKPLNANI